MVSSKVITYFNYTNILFVKLFINKKKIYEVCLSLRNYT